MATTREPARATPSSADDVITVGSFDFTESVVLAEVYSQALEAAGYRGASGPSISARASSSAPALAAGLVELLPEYAGTAAEFHSLGTAEPTDDVAVTHDELDASRSTGATSSPWQPAPAQDANTFVVTQGDGRAPRRSRTLSDLAAVAGELTFGGPAECPARPHCPGSA